MLVGMVERLGRDKQLLPLNPALPDAFADGMPNYGLVAIVPAGIDISVTVLQAFLQVVGHLPLGEVKRGGEADKGEGLVVGKLENGNCPFLFLFLLSHNINKKVLIKGVSC